MCKSGALRIGRMGHAQARSVADLIAAVIEPLEYYPEPVRQHEIDKYSPARLRKRVQDDSDSVLVAILGAEIAGFCLNHYDDRLIWLEWFGVRREFRGAGIGRALLQTLERTAPARGCHKVWCDCRTTNLTSRAVLTKAGYRNICTLTNHWYGLDFILWEKPIVR